MGRKAGMPTTVVFSSSSPDPAGLRARGSHQHRRPPRSQRKSRRGQASASSRTAEPGQDSHQSCETRLPLACASAARSVLGRALHIMNHPPKKCRRSCGLCNMRLKLAHSGATYRACAALERMGRQRRAAPKRHAEAAPVQAGPAAAAAGALRAQQHRHRELGILLRGLAEEALLRSA